MKESSGPVPISREFAALEQHLLIGALFDAAPDAILVVRGDGRIAVANHRAEELFGVSVTKLVDQPVDVLLPERLRVNHGRLMASYHAAPRVREMGTGTVSPLIGRRFDGAEFPVEVSLSPLGFGDEDLVIAIVRDIGERVARDRELLDAQRELATMADRERIAQNLHDTVIQKLYGAGMSLQAALGRIPDPLAADRVNLVIDEIDDAIRAIRTTIFAIGRHQRAGEARARDEILAISEEAARALGFVPRVDFRGPVDTLLPVAVLDELLPTLREALSNVARHAHATRVAVVVTVSPDVTLDVTDDGVGLDEGTRRGGGLRNLQARAASLGGSMQVTNGPRSGVTLRWHVPLAVTPPAP